MIADLFLGLVIFSGFMILLFSGISALRNGDKQKSAVNLFFALLWLGLLLFGHHK